MQKRKNKIGEYERPWRENKKKFSKIACQTNEELVLVDVDQLSDKNSVTSKIKDPIETSELKHLVDTALLIKSCSS
jgi:hypothetical protein